MNVVIVCSGESVLQSRAGEIIDNMDVVVRIGNFVITGYESHIGTKTDIVLAYDWQHPEIRDNNTTILSPEDILTQEDKDVMYTDTKYREPTTGICGYYIIRKLIPTVVSIYYHGMDFLQGGCYWDSEHSNISNTVRHEPLLERLWFTRRCSDGSIIKLIG